jgi:hypothetical protein
MTDEPKARPRKSTTPVHDLIVKFRCPCGCNVDYFLPIVIENQQAYERDDIGVLIKDAEGNLVPKLRISHVYDQVPHILRSWSPMMNDHYKILWERAEEEGKYAEKKRKPTEQLVAEQAS